MSPYVRCVGHDDSIPDYATLVARFPPTIEFLDWAGFVTPAAGPTDVYICRRTAVGVYEWQALLFGASVETIYEDEEVNFGKLFDLYATMFDTASFQTRTGVGFYNRIETDGEGGRAELQTGNLANDQEGSLFDNRYITRAREPDIGAVFYPVSLTNVRFGFGLYRGAGDYIFVGYDSSVGPNIIVETNNPGGTEQLDSGVAAVAGAWAYYRFQIAAATGFPSLQRYDVPTQTWVTIAIAPSVGIGANVYVPYWFIQTLANASKRYMLEYLFTKYLKMIF